MPEKRERYPRNESTAQRADRRYSELMQELRVTQTGVQVLVGFLFTIAFSNRFRELNADQRILYVVTLVLGASATAVLIAPVSFHRILFTKRMKPELVRATNLLTLLGLGLLMCTISAAVLLVFELVLPGPAVAWLAAGVTGWFVLLWYLVPLWLSVRRSIVWEEDRPDGWEDDGVPAPGAAGGMAATRDGPQDSSGAEDGPREPSAARKAWRDMAARAGGSVPGRRDDAARR